MAEFNKVKEEVLAVYPDARCQRFINNANPHGMDIRCAITAGNKKISVYFDAYGESLAWENAKENIKKGK